MAYIEIDGHGDMTAFGRSLQPCIARTHARHFSWYRDNTLGTMPQINTQTDDWCEFWRAQRLGYQLERAAAAGYGGTLQRKSQRLLTSFDKLFSDYNPQPALLHGNLWSGNYAMDRNGQAIIFDPTVYYGDREADLTMTELFGGFAHVLNHLNLFGDTYVRRAEQMMDFVLGELGKLPQYPE